MDAIIYIRWSSLEQKKGDSYTRQINATTKFCVDNGYKVVETVVDEGRSAYTGENIHTGNLGKLVQRYERRAVAPSTPIVVEQLDRLTRLPPLDVVGWLTRIFPHGVRFLTADKAQDISKAAMDRDPMAFMALIFDSFRSNSESARKADLLSKSWQSRRDAVAAGRRRNITGVCPAWMKWDKQDERFKLIEGRPEILQRIFDESDAGAGIAAITRRLNEDGVPSWGLGVNRCSDGWHTSYIQKILRNPAVIGEFTPRSRKKADIRGRVVGETIPDYYPQVISPAQFERVSSKRSKRNVGGAWKTRRNLLAGLCFCAKCNQTMSFIRKNTAGREMVNPSTGHVYVVKYDGLYLRCSGAHRGNRCDHKKPFNYVPIETAVLDAILHLALDDGQFAQTELIGQLDDQLTSAKRELARFEQRADAALEMTLEPAFKHDARIRNKYVEARREAEAQQALVSKLTDDLSSARGAVTPVEHVQRVASVRDAINAEDELVRDAARGKVMEALQSIVTRITFRPDRTIELAAIEGAVGFQFDEKGNLLQSVNLYNRLDLRKGIEHRDAIKRPDIVDAIETVERRRKKSS